MTTDPPLRGWVYFFLLQWIPKGTILAIATGAKGTCDLGKEDYK